MAFDSICPLSSEWAHTHALWQAIHNEWRKEPIQFAELYPGDLESETQDADAIEANFAANWKRAEAHK